MRPIHALPVVLVAAALAGCGGGDGNGDGGPATTSGASSAPATTQQQQAQAQTQTQTQAQTQAQAQTQTSRAKPPAANAGGAKVFASAGCASCHTFKAANASGNVGPNLDELQLTPEIVQQQVENGGGGMPSFSGDLSQSEIDMVARYVSENQTR